MAKLEFIPIDTVADWYKIGRKIIKKHLSYCFKSEPKPEAKRFAPKKEHDHA